MDIEYPVINMPLSTNPSGKGYVDYVLWDDNGKPLAVIEAKSTLHDPMKDQHQPSIYAGCLEQTTGQRPIIFYTIGYDTYICSFADYTVGVYPPSYPSGHPPPSHPSSRWAWLPAPTPAPTLYNRSGINIDNKTQYYRCLTPTPAWSLTWLLLDLYIDPGHREIPQCRQTEQVGKDLFLHS